MIARLALGVLCAAACACAVGVHHRSANPYEPDRGPSQGGGGIGASPVIAAAASAQRRLDGECYVPCLKGTVCNKETGLCDPLPCRGECRENEICDESGLLPKCVPSPEIDLRIDRAVEATPP